jgi:hypothetical protein
LVHASRVEPIRNQQPLQIEAAVVISGGVSLFGFWSFYSTVDPLGLTGVGIISWVGYAPTRMDQLLMMAPSELMDQLGMTDELRNYNEQMVAAAQEREQARETKQQASTQAWTGNFPFSSGKTNCSKLTSGSSSANFVYGFSGGTSTEFDGGPSVEDQEIGVYELKEWQTKLPGIQQTGEWDCFYTAMGMIDAYYGNDRGPEFFKTLNGGREGITPEEMPAVISKAGYLGVKVTSFYTVGKAMEKGHPSIVGEISSGNAGHITIPVVIQLCGYGLQSEQRTSVMDPGFGRVMPRSIEYWEQSRRLDIYIIYK